MDTYSLILDILGPALFLFYGYKFRFQTPPFNDKNGLGTKYARKSEKAWILGNRYGGLVCLIMGGLLAIMVALKYLVFGVDNRIASYVCLAVELLCVVLLIPIVNARLKKEFGE